MELVIKNYLTYKSKVDEQFRRWLDLGVDFSEMTKQSFSGLSPFSFFKPPADGKDEESEP